MFVLLGDNRGFCCDTKTIKTLKKYRFLLITVGAHHTLITQKCAENNIILFVCPPKFCISSLR